MPQDFHQLVLDVYREDLGLTQGKQIASTLGCSDGNLSQYFNKRGKLEPQSVSKLIRPLKHVRSRLRIVEAWLREVIPDGLEPLDLLQTIDLSADDPIEEAYELAEGYAKNEPGQVANVFDKLDWAGSAIFDDGELFFFVHACALRRDRTDISLRLARTLRKIGEIQPTQRRLRDLIVATIEYEVAQCLGFPHKSLTESLERVKRTNILFAECMEDIPYSDDMSPTRQLVIQNEVWPTGPLFRLNNPETVLSSEELERLLRVATQEYRLAQTSFYRFFRSHELEARIELACGRFDRASKAITRLRLWQEPTFSVWHLNLEAYYLEFIGDHTGALKAYGELKQVSRESGNVRMARECRNKMALLVNGLPQPVGIVLPDSQFEMFLDATE